MEPDFRFRRLGYVALNVTDLKRSVPFYADVVGLDCVAETHEAAYLRCSDEHHDIVLCRAARPGLRRVGWQVESTRDLQALTRKLAADGLSVDRVPVAECDALGQGET